MRINLLPIERRMQPTRYRNLALLAAVLLCAIGALSYYSYRLVLEVAELRAARDSLATAVSALAPVDALLKEDARLRQELVRLQGEAAPQVARLMPYVDELARLLPDAVALSELSVDASSLSFSGEAPSYAAAATLLRWLEGSDVFANPRLRGLQASPNGYRFEVVVETKVGSP